MAISLPRPNKPKRRVGVETGNPEIKAKLAMFHKKSILFIISAFLILLLISCGLDTISTLNPPEFVVFSDADNFFTFRSAGDHDAYDPYILFMGFELYYKIYLNDAPTESDLLSLSELTSYGFKRIASADDLINNISKPLIPLDSANHDDTFEIAVDFNGIELKTTEAFAAANDSTVAPAVSLSVELRRGIADDRPAYPDEYKPFSIFEEGDADISGAIWTDISGNNNVTLVIYAVSHGKRDLIIDVYSIAVYLGEIDIKLPY